MHRRACEIVLWLVLGVATGTAHAAAAPASTERASYGVLYTAWIKPSDPWATVRIRLTLHPDWVRWVRFDADPTRYRGFKGSGQVEIKGADVLWRPAGQKGEWLQYQVRLESKRASGAYDGRVTPDWALFRGDDLAPVTRVDMQDGTQSRTKLRLNVPEGWSVEAPYARYKSGRLAIETPGWFDRPIGWFLVGKVGTRRETIGATRVSVSAPTSEGVHRLDILAFLRWTLPEMHKVFPDFPKRLLVVGAGDPMWRGALSGPASLFVHADRPMISENATSTYLHELTHVAMRARSRPDSDWIVEGMAEYYALEVLHRAGGLSDKRYEAAHAALATWGKEAPTLEVADSSGAVTARAVGVLRGIDRDIRRSSGGKRSLDDVARALAAEDRPVTRARFDELVAQASRAP